MSTLVLYCLFSLWHSRESYIGKSLLARFYEYSIGRPFWLTFQSYHSLERASNRRRGYPFYGQSFSASKVILAIEVVEVTKGHLGLA